MRAAIKYGMNPGVEPFVTYRGNGNALVCRNGTMVWLNWWELLLLEFGLTNARKLEAKLENTPILS